MLLSDKPLHASNGIVRAGALSPRRAVSPPPSPCAVSAVSLGRWSQAPGPRPQAPLSPLSPLSPHTAKTFWKHLGAGVFAGVGRLEGEEPALELPLAVGAEQGEVGGVVDSVRHTGRGFRLGATARLLLCVCDRAGAAAKFALAHLGQLLVVPRQDGRAALPACVRRGVVEGRARDCCPCAARPRGVPSIASAVIAPL